VKGRLGVERDVDLAQRFVLLQGAIDPGKHHLLLGLGKLQADQPQRLFERFLADARAGLLSGPRRLGGHCRQNLEPRPASHSHILLVGAGFSPPETSVPANR